MNGGGEKRWFKKGIAKQRPEKAPNSYQKEVRRPNGMSLWISPKQI